MPLWAGTGSEGIRCPAIQPKWRRSNRHSSPPSREPRKARHPPGTGSSSRTRWQGSGTIRSCDGLDGHCWTGTLGRLADTRDSPSPIIQGCARASWLHRWPSRPRCCSGSTRTSSERLPLGYESVNAGLPDGARAAEGRPRRSGDSAVGGTVLPPRRHSKAQVIVHVMKERWLRSGGLPPGDRRPWACGSASSAPGAIGPPDPRRHTP